MNEKVYWCDEYEYLFIKGKNGEENFVYYPDEYIQLIMIDILEKENYVEIGDL